MHAPERPWVLSFALGGVTTLLHVLTAQGYGVFRDELYYLACGEHLGFGYVDHPPFVGYVAWFARSVFGESIVGLRLLPALAAGATVVLALRMAREMGGGVWAQVWTAVLTALAPVYLSIFGYLSMNAFDFLFWSAAFLVVVRILRTQQLRLWLVFGLVVGVGLQNKLSIGFLAAGVVVGLLVTRQWQHFTTRWLWLAGAIAFVLFLPYVIWQMLHGWPTLEFIDNATRYKITNLNPIEFALAQVTMMNPLAVPLSLAGLVFLLALPTGRPYRALGWAFVTVFVILVSQNSKAYYLAPSYTLLFAAGSVVCTRALERLASRGVRQAVAAVVTGVFVASNLAMAPMAKPILPIETFVAYQARLGLGPSSGENHALGRLPQFFADRIGWRELAETVAGVFETLPAEDRARACIYTQNYGQAGAIDFFGPALGLPRAMSGHNSYWTWGPGDCSGDVVIVIGGRRENHEASFESVQQATTYTCNDCMPYENNKPIWICRGMRLPIATAWRNSRHFD